MNRSKVKSFLPRLILSLFLALLVWYSINGNSSNIITRYLMNIPVTFVNGNELRNKGYWVENDVNYYVNLELRGTEASLDQISPNDISAQINLAEVVSSGAQSLPVVINGLNNTVILDQATPSEIELNVEEITNKDFTPTILTQGKPEANYSVVSASTTETVNINGPAEEVNKTNTISGIANVDGLSANSYQFVELHAYDEEGNLLPDVEITPNSVESEVLIGVTKQVNVEAPLITNSPANGYKVESISVSPKSIRIAGSENEVNSINNLKVNSISIPEAQNTHTFTLDSDIIIPDGVSIIGNNPVASVEVGIEKVNEKVFNVTEFDFEGLDPNLEVERINPGYVTVTLSGTITELSRIDNSVVKGILDLTDLGAGEYVVPVNLNLNEVSLLMIQPQSIEITLKNK